MVQAKIGMTGGFAFDVQAVCAGNMLAKCIGSSYIAGPQPLESLDAVAEMAGIDAGEMDYVVDEVQERMVECTEILACGNDMPACKIAA